MSEEKKIENAVTMYDRISDPMAAIEKMGEWISKSGLFGCEKVEQGMILAMTSYAERRPVTDICRRYHIMDGKLSMKAEAMLAEFNQHGGQHFWEKSDDKEAVLLLTFGKFKDFRVTYTIKDAERAGLCGKDGVMRQGQQKPGGWQKNPDALLRARTVSKGIRMVDPSVIVGIYTPEEIIDMQIEGDHVVPARSLLGAPAPSVLAPIPPSTIEPLDTSGNTEQQPREVPEVQTVTGDQSVTTVMKLSEALEGMTGDANDWLIAKGWIKNQQTFRNLPEAKMQEILGRLQNFKMAVKASKN